MKCKHRGTWLLCGGNFEWCYRCGALRRMGHQEPNVVYPKTYWLRPVGEYKQNPCSLKDLPKK